MSKIIFHEKILVLRAGCELEHFSFFHRQNNLKLECGPMPNVMAAQPLENVYIVYQPRRRPNIIQSLVGLR